MERKTFTKEFKLGAVRMVTDQGMKSADVCRDLGISSSALARWLSDYRKHGDGSFPGKGQLTAQDAKIRELERQCRRFQMERDILKKTVALFAELERKGTLS